MAKVRTWFADEDEKLRRRNDWARLYFEPGRSRLMLPDGFVDFANLRDRAYAMAWCQANGVGFFDHRPELLPADLRECIRRARATGVGELRELKSRWRLIPLPGAELCTPQLGHIPCWKEVKEMRPPRTPQDYPAPRFWNGTKHHAYTCGCYACCASREAGRLSVF